MCRHGEMGPSQLFGLLELFVKLGAGSNREALSNELVSKVQ